MALHRLHVLESRSAAFKRDKVLQENVIFHAVKAAVKPDRVAPRQITVLRHADGLISDRICDQLFAMFLNFTIHGEIKHATNYTSVPAPLL